jgi:hypothetical protein
MQKKLYLFVEGEWDKVFFKTFLEARLCEDYDFEEIEYLEFAENLYPREKLRQLAKERKINFLLCPDLDAGYDKLKMEIKKAEKISKLVREEFKIEEKEEIEMIKNKSFVIVQEIESWYLAGFDEDFCNKAQFRKQFDYHRDTTKTNKSTFETIARKLKTSPSVLRDMLTKTYRYNFDIEEAKERNESFRKFFAKVANQTKRLSQ